MQEAGKQMKEAADRNNDKTLGNLHENNNRLLAGESVLYMNNS